MKTIHSSLLVAVMTTAFINPALAQQAAPTPAAASASAADASFAAAEVRKVDKSNGRLTLKHGEIKSLDMPPMTMVFGVKDPAMLEQVKVGDKVRFRASGDGGKYTVTEIQTAP